jgi:hypothetical protein
MPIPSAFAAFRAEIVTYQGIITKAFTQDAAGAYMLTSQERSFVVDSSFLRIFIAWEGFLEGVCVGYMRGYPSSSGKTALRFATPVSDQHAREILIGTQKFVDWANPEIVRKLVKLYLTNGEPIDGVISAIQGDLFDLKTIRNAAAHLTSTTGKALDALASRRLHTVQRNISVGDFVLSVNPDDAGGGSILNTYIDLLDAAADNIANWA